MLDKNKVSLLNYHIRIPYPRDSGGYKYNATGMSFEQKWETMQECCWSAENYFTETRPDIYAIRNSVLYMKLGLYQGDSRIMDLYFGSCALREKPSGHTVYRSVLVKRKKAVRKLEKQLIAYERSRPCKKFLFMPYRKFDAWAYMTSGVDQVEVVG